MINDTLHFLGKQLNAYLQNEFELAEEPVVVSPLINIDGSTIAATEKKLVITLINIGLPASLRNMEIPGNAMGMRAPASSVLINILLSANFEAHVYGQGLNLLSAAMLYLQQNPMFHLPAKDPDSNGTRFTVEMNNLTTEVTSQLWTGLGARYLPSTNYTIRTIL